MKIRRLYGRVSSVLFLLILLACGAAAGWYFLIYAKSPQYALNQFLSAAKANDTSKVTQLSNTTGALLLAINQAGIAQDAVALIYPGYNNITEFGTVKSASVESMSVEGDTAEAKMKLEVEQDGKTNTLTPTYVLHKSDDGWKVAIEATIGSSFNQLISAEARKKAAKTIRDALKANPAMATMAKQMIGGAAEPYPEVKTFLKEAGL